MQGGWVEGSTFSLNGYFKLWILLPAVPSALLVMTSNTDVFKGAG